MYDIAVMLVISAFFSAAIVHIQKIPKKLPLDNLLLRDLGCLNPKKLDRKSTQVAIQNCLLHLNIEVICVNYIYSKSNW